MPNKLTKKDALSFSKVISYHLDLFTKVAENHIQDGEIILAFACANDVKNLIDVEKVVTDNLKYEGII